MAEVHGWVRLPLHTQQLDYSCPLGSWNNPHTTLYHSGDLLASESNPLRFEVCLAGWGETQEHCTTPFTFDTQFPKCHIHPLPCRSPLKVFLVKNFLILGESPRWYVSFFYDIQVSTGVAKE